MATHSASSKKSARTAKVTDGKKDPWVIVKRPAISLCVHGINEKYCKTCLDKKAAKANKKASAKTSAK